MTTDLSEEDLKRLREEEEQFQTEESHGDGMEVNVSREPSNDVSTSVSGDEPGLDLSLSRDVPEADKKNPEFPSAEEANEAFMSEEEKLQNQIAELESKAKERESRIKQKQHLRDLKKRVQSAKVKEAVAPAAERLEPLVSAGKRTADFLGQAKQRVDERAEGSPIGTFGQNQQEEDAGRRLGSGLSLGQKSSLGITGKRSMGHSLKQSKNELRPKTGKKNVSDVMKKKQNMVGFSDKKDSMFSFGKKESAIDWGAKKDSAFSLGSDKNSGISFDSKPGSGFNLFGDDKQSKKKKKKKSRKKKDSLDINLIIKGGK